MPPTDSYIPGRYEPIEATGYAGASVGLPLVEPELEPDQDDLRSTSLDEGIRDPSSDNSTIQVVKHSSVISEPCYIPPSGSRGNSGRGRGDQDIVNDKFTQFQYPTATQSRQYTSRVPIETIVQTKEKDSRHQFSSPQLDTATSISDTREHVARVSEIGRNNQKPRTNVVIETTALPVKPGHIAKELFAFCMKAYQSSLPIIIGLDIDKTRAKMQEEMGRLALWGDSYTVSEGELDILFKSSKDKYLKESTIILLCSIAKTLNSCLSILNTHTSQETSQDSNSSATPPHTTEPTSRLILTKVLVGASNGKDLNTKGLYDLHSETKTDARPAMQEAPRANQYSADGLRLEMRYSLQALLNVVQGLMPEIAGLIEQDSSDDDGDDPLDLRLRLSEAVEDIKDSLDSLFDLVPSIDELCLVTEETIAKEHGQTRVSTIEPAEIPTLFEAQAYKINIQDKFPEVEEQLAETLAGINWARHRRIREWAETHEKGDEATQGPSGTIFADSGIGSSNNTLQGISAPTQKNAFSDCRSEASATSFGTKNSTVSGGIYLPKPPVPLSPGITFECSICFKVLKGVDTNILWKKHVLRDLRPYSCLFGSCTEKINTFESRKAWMTHEFTHHRPQSTPMWRCSETCANGYKRREEFVQHILEDHLEGTVTASDIDDIVDNCKVEIPSETIRCPFCPEYIPENRGSIQRHIGTHMDEIALKSLPLNFECESNAPSGDDATDQSSADGFYAGFSQAYFKAPIKEAKTLSELMCNPKQQYKRKLKQNKCPDCGEVFQFEARLKSHQVVHSKQKWQCDICGSEFGRQSSLKRHQFTPNACQKKKDAKLRQTLFQNVVGGRSDGQDFIGREEATSVDPISSREPGHGKIYDSPYTTEYSLESLTSASTITGDITNPEPHDTSHYDQNKPALRLPSCLKAGSLSAPLPGEEQTLYWSTSIDESKFEQYLSYD